MHEALQGSMLPSTSLANILDSCNVLVLLATFLTKQGEQLLGPV
jgi:hypothetical protein